MTNWQFITLIGTFVLSFFGFILTILGTARATQAAIQSSMNEQFTAFRNEIRAELASVRSELKGDIETLRQEIRQNDKRYEERFARLEADICEIKQDFRQVLKPVLPG
jgi:septal ring factor EnvC (AmiA/AmiB activator)